MQFTRQAVARSELYQAHLGEDIAGRLAHHAARMKHHHEAYTRELERLRSAAYEVGIRLPQLPSTDWK